VSQGNYLDFPYNHPKKVIHKNICQLIKNYGVSHGNWLYEQICK
jgi:hypothetical protein